MPLIRRTPDPPAGGSAAPGDPFEGLKSLSAEARWAAARALTREPDGPAALVEALADEADPRVREAIFTGLARAGTPAAVEALLAQLRSDEASLRTGALDALRAAPVVARPYLPALLRDPDPDVRLLACDIVRELTSEDATPLLCELLERESQVNVCAAAVEVLAEIGSPPALEVLSRCAGRFAGEPFLVFSIKVASERIGVSARGPA